MHRTLIIALIALFAVAPASAEDAKLEEQVWQGYLYRDAKKRIQIGWPVIAMGVMEQPDFLVGGPLAAKIGPLVSDQIGNSYVFWNYTLEKEEGLAKVPRILVRLRGNVSEAGGSRDLFGGGARTMVDAKLDTVEFLSEAWLTTWGRIFRLDHSPFAIRLNDDPLSKKERAAKLAPEVIAIIEALRKHAGPTDAQRKLAASIAPDARVVQRHRTSSEHNLMRWVRTVNEMHGLKLEGLDELGVLPPEARQVAAWFRDAKSKSAFIENVKAKWKGDLAHVVVAYYRVHGRGVSLARIDVARLAEEWTDEEFISHRDATTKNASR